MSEQEENESVNNNNNNSYANNDIPSINLDEADSENENKFKEHAREKMLWRIFDEKQKARYEKYKRSGLEYKKKNRSTQKFECPRTKKIVQNILGENVQISNQVQNVIQVIAKIYAGELVEEAKMILVNEEGLKETYPSIKPKHLREARRRMIQRGLLPMIKQKFEFP